MLFAGSPQLDAYEREDPYVSIYRINDGQTGAALAVTWRGLFPSAVAAKLAEKLKDLAGRLDEVPWTACVTHGFRDSPVSFHGSQLARDGPGLSFVCLTASEDGTWTAYETGR